MRTPCCVSRVCRPPPISRIGDVQGTLVGIELCPDIPFEWEAYVVQRRIIPVIGCRAKHKRHGIALEITSYRSASGGIPRYAWIGTEILSGLMYATINIARHISIANCAFVFARLGLASLPWWVMHVIGATNGRIPCMTCEYRLTKEDRHCQYCRVCGL
jgi:hypothetical protein